MYPFSCRELKYSNPHRFCKAFSNIGSPLFCIGRLPVFPGAAAQPLNRRTAKEPAHAGPFKEKVFHFMGCSKTICIGGFTIRIVSWNPNSVFTNFNKNFDFFCAFCAHPQNQQLIRRFLQNLPYPGSAPALPKPPVRERQTKLRIPRG